MSQQLLSFPLLKSGVRIGFIRRKECQIVGNGHSSADRFGFRPRGPNQPAFGRDFLWRGQIGGLIRGVNRFRFSSWQSGDHDRIQIPFLKHVI